jgi:curved DNA-binding protein CbpA
MIKINKKHFCIIRDLCYDPKGDYYNILGIKDNSEPSEIKKSFFSLSMKLHPDKGGKEEDFKKISKAYEILRNPEQRNVYDKLRQEFLLGENRKVEQIFEKSKKKHNEQNNFYRNSRQRHYYEDEFKYYRKNWNSTYKNPNWDESRNTSNQSNDYRQTKEEDFFKIYNEYYEYLRSFLRQNKAKQHRSYKINIKYIPPERENLFEEFVFTKKNKHFLSNRIQNYEEVKKSKKNENQFKIFNEMNQDQDYLDCLNKIHNEDESLDKKIRIREFKKLSLSMALIVISYCIIALF